MAPMEYCNDDQEEEESCNYDRAKEAKEAKEFDESKTGVKGLVDSGITTIPRLFIHHHPAPATSSLIHGVDVISIPIIDLSNPVRTRVVERVRDAAAESGFFQIINHGVPVSVMDDTLSAIKAFNELPAEEKKPFYHPSGSGDEPGSVFFLPNPVRSKAATWRDTFKVNAPAGRLGWDRVPAVCRAQLMEWDRATAKLERDLVELLCEGLGLGRDRLEKVGCLEWRHTVAHYYPHCPQPELTWGTVAHTDHLLLTLLMQGQGEGLQVKRGDDWVDVKPLHGSLVINIGDLFQIMSNGLYTSMEHRVVANSRKEPRISIANFVGPREMGNYRSYGPLPELVLDDRPAEYRNFTMEEFMREFLSTEISSVANRFKI